MKGVSLLDVTQLHVEDQRRVGRNDWRRSLGTVGHGRRARDASLGADLHASHTQIPAADHLAATQVEGEALAALRAVEHLVVGLEATLVVHLQQRMKSTHLTPDATNTKPQQVHLT